MGIGLHKELKVWHESIELIKKIYLISNKLPKDEDYNLKQQLKRAVVSVALNIAEGKNRKTIKDFSNFINISYASLCEVDSILDICESLNYINDTKDIRSQIENIAKMLNSLKNSLNRKDF
jgi:four helix bundle protein